MWVVTQCPEFADYTRNAAMRIVGLNPDSVDVLLGETWGH
jgi:hypothetical protein